MTKGNIGVAFLLFGILVGTCRWFNLFGFGLIEESWLQPVRLVTAFGGAICIVALVRRFLSGEL